MRFAALALLLALAGGAHAQDAAQPQGQPATAHPPRDAEFGVVAHGFGLQRQVEMLQWRRFGPGYRKEWSAQPIDSSGYAKAYRNPAGFPIETRYWIAEDATLDGKPIDDDVLKEFGNWRDFRPGFSALPANLAATFQPEGDGLGTADNPLDPQVGDLRVRWRELELPPLQGRVALQGGVWIPASDAVPENVVAASDTVADASTKPDRWLWWIAAAVVLAIGGAWWLRRRRG
ncbi:MAG: TMEM43 family protein [Lysobacterales bacterium]